MILCPMLIERVDFLDCIPVSRDKLIQFTKEIEEEHTGIHFDYSMMNKIQD